MPIFENIQRVIQRVRGQAGTPQPSPQHTTSAICPEDTEYAPPGRAAALVNTLLASPEGMPVQQEATTSEPGSVDPTPVHRAHVFIRSREEAIQEAFSVAYGRDFDGSGRPHRTYFVDGSRDEMPPMFMTRRHAGYSVVIKTVKQGYRHSGHIYGIEGSYCLVQAKKIAVVEALADAASLPDIDNSIVQVFLDSEEALQHVSDGIQAEFTGDFDRDITRPIDIAMAKVEERLHTWGCHMEFHWVPATTCSPHDLARTLSMMACLSFRPQQSM